MPMKYDTYPLSNGVRVKPQKNGERLVFLMLSKGQIEGANAGNTYSENEEVQFLTVQPKNDRLILHPIVMLRTSRSDFLEPRYSRIEKIILEGFNLSNIEVPEDVRDTLENVPSGFTKDFDAGLGLAHDYRHIITQIEHLTKATTLTLTNQRPTAYNKDSNEFILAFREFDELRRTIDRITASARNAAGDVKELAIYNQLAPAAAKQEKTIRLRKNAMTRRFQNFLQHSDGLDEEDHAELLNMASTNARRFSETQPPEKIEELREEIQIAALDSLISQFEDMLTKKLQEKDWQNFFQSYPILLSLAFGYSAILVGQHIAVGGRTHAGVGEKVTDFLYKNELTGNAALFEIKTPQTELLDLKNEYRSGVYAPNRGLGGAITQVLDQRYQYQVHFTSHQLESEDKDIRPFAVACFVIAGTIPDKINEKKSLELLRRNSRDVEIIAYDELLLKLKRIQSFLAQDTDTLS